MSTVTYYLLLAPPILLALTFHEFAHAYVAFRLGDDTAEKQGRLTLNPLAHLDWLGTLMLFIIQLGWAKPVPVNPNNFKNPRQGMLWVALAGPLSNILLAAALGAVYRFSLSFDQSISIIGANLLFMIRFGVLINLILAFFNLLPIPPLDGSKVLFTFVPARFDHLIASFSRIGPLLLLALIVIGNRANFQVIWPLIRPPVRLLATVFGNIDF